MKLTDLGIYISNSLRNVKTGKWDIEQGKIFILLKIEKYLGISISELTNNELKKEKEIIDEEPF